MTPLYAPEERMDVPGFLRHRFGTDEPPEGHGNMWRLALTAHTRDSYNFFASNFCYVADKRGNLTTLNAFVGQAIHRVALDSQMRAELPGRIAEVKARQVGFTTENIARGLHYVLDENRRAMLLVDDEDVAQEQSRRLGTMLNGLPGFMQPMRRIQNLKHLIFDNPNQKDRMTNPGLDSAYQIMVPASMRGVPQGFVCISEYAFMETERQEQVWTGVISAAPLTPNSIIIIDTTPNGVGDSYHEMVLEAVEDNPKWTKRIENWKGELTTEDVYAGALGVPDTVARGYPGQYVPVILPWRFHEEFTARDKTHPRGEIRPLTKAQRGETESSLGKVGKYGGDEELWLRDKYGVSTERLFWRRRKIDGYKLPTEEMKLLAFRQEFLTDIESAFIDSGKTIFDRACMDAISRQVKQPIAVGLFEAEDKFAYWFADGASITSVHRDPNPWQEIRIYAPPQNGEKYTMGVDTDIAYESPDSDATVAQIVRFRDNKVVATYEARVPSNELLRQLYYLYRWYFNCYYAIETAGMGYDLVRRCIDRGMSNCHYYKRYDKDLPEPTAFPGWETKTQTRPLMDQTATELLCARNRESGKPEPDIIIPDAKTVKEIRGLRRTPSGSFKNTSGGHDDHYDALCLTGDALITVRGGVKRADEIREGDEVLTHMGRFRRVLVTASRLATPVEMKASGVMPLKVTRNHPLWVTPYKLDHACRRARKDTRWQSLDDIGPLPKRGGVFIRAASPLETKARMIDLANYVPPTYLVTDTEVVPVSYGNRRSAKGKTLPRHIPVDESLGFVLGYFAAEGSVGSHNISFASHVNERALRDMVANYFEKFGVLNCVRDQNEKSVGAPTKSRCITISNVPFRNLFSEFGSKVNKHFPAWCEELPSEVQHHILSGYLAGDGCFTDGKVRVASCSPHIGIQVLGMARRLGYRPTFRFIKRAGKYDHIGGYSAKDQYAVEFNRQDSRAIVKRLPVEVTWAKRIAIADRDAEHNHVNIINEHGVALHPIRTVSELLPEQTVYNFYVEEDNSYCANGVTVHNCIALCIARDPYSGLHRQIVTEAEDKKKEFEASFAAMTRMGAYSRNRPDLSML